MNRQLTAASTLLTRKKGARRWLKTLRANDALARAHAIEVPQSSRDRDLVRGAAGK